jgi:hypothetical protein
MPKIHNIGPNHFVQYIEFPVVWGAKLWVKGWTQEISPPFRTSEPLIVRMPFHKAFVMGKWTGKVEDEEVALTRAIQRRTVTNEDFSEERGWTPAPEQVGKESSEYFDY